MKKNEILFTAFLEGGLVMLLEVSSPLVVAPVLGSSINVWAALITLSITALAIGYFLGGKYALKGATTSSVVSVFAINSVVVFVGWLLIFFQNNYSMMSGYQYLSWFIIFVLLFVPLVLFGFTTPILIAALNINYKQDSDIVGKVYSLSTVGGIIFSVLAGFYFIPLMGLSHTLLLAIIISGVIPFYSFFKLKKIKIYAPLGVLILFSIIAINKSSTLSNSSSIKLLEYSEGINGQLIVADVFKEDHTERMLFINRMGQTWFNLTTNYSVWSYPNYITSLGSMFPTGSNSLVLGLGGGIVSKQLKEYCKHNVDAVELDSRIIEISKKEFNLKNSGVKIVQDDARRFIKKNKKKYDFIVLDIFNGEIAPSHGLSKESFEDIKKILNPNGMIVINFNGFLTNREGRAGRSLYKTLSEAGFSTKLFATDEKDEANRNILYMAYLKEPHWENVLINVKTDKGEEYKIAEHFLDSSKIDFSDALVITDDKPMMEHLNRFAANKWREDYFNNFTLKFKEDYKIPLIN